MLKKLVGGFVLKYIIALMLMTSNMFLIALDWDSAVPIRQGVNIEWFRTGTNTDDGCAIYVWSDTKLGARDLYAQKVDASGNMVWGDPLLVDGKIDRQEDPVITKAADGNFVIAWIDFSDDLDGNVYAQKVSSSGQLLWQTGGVPVCVYPGIQISLNIEPDNTGGAYIIWEDSRNPGKDLYGQRLNGSGTPQWTLNGIPIANAAGDESYNTMWSDGTGGLIIGYVYALSGAETLLVKRFLPDGQMAWTQPLVLSPTIAIQNKIKMSPINGDSFVFTWQDARGGNPDIFAQRVNVNGTILWNDPLVVYTDSTSTETAPQENPRIVQTSDNGVIIIWEDKRNDLDGPDLYAQKLDLNGQRLWDVSGIPLAVAPFYQQGPRMSADSNGGCYVVWDDARNGNAPNIDIYMQHISSTGTALWQDNGIAVCTSPNEQSGSLVKVSNNNIFVNWMDMRNGSLGINYQVYNSSGQAQLAENGAVVFWGLSGDASLKQVIVLPRQNDVAIVWQDTRFANLGYQIFYQILNADGTVDYEVNGRSVTVLTGSNQQYPASVVLPDGKICVVWQENRVSNYKIYAQLIDTDGSRLWGDMGMAMTDTEPLSQKDPKVTYFDGAIYIGWSNLDVVETSTGPRQFFHVYGQKIIGNTKQWNADGVLISEVNPDDMLFECQLEQIVNRYYVWTRTSVSPSTFGQLNVWAKLVNVDGNTAAGWSDYGVVTSNYSDWDTNQYLPKAAVTDAGLFVGWLDFRSDFIKNLYGQMISATGSIMWNPSGVSLADFGREQDELSLLGGSDITFAWKESVTGSNQDIAIQRYSTSGSPIWGDMGFYVVERDTTQSSPNLARFSANNSMIVAWEDYADEDADIYCKFIEADGTLLGGASSPGILICGEIMIQQYPQCAIINDTPEGSAVIVWSDGRSSGKEPIFGLYAQKIDNLTPIVDDNNNFVAPNINLKQNYPNPFNPETEINFSLQKNEERIELSVYNIKGQMVKELFSGKAIKGNHNFVWDGKDSEDNNVSAGVYFYRLTSDAKTLTRKMVLMK
jgi:hypothetical protein